MMRWMAVWVAVSGCASHYGPCLGANEPEDAIVDTSAEEVVFDWRFGTAYALSVYELDEDGHGREMWHVQCGGDNLEDDHSLEAQVCIPTPITYGDHVDSEYVDNVNSTEPKQLIPGATYTLMIHTLIEEDGPPPESDLPEWLGFLEGGPDRDDPHCGSAFSAEVDFVAPDPA